MLWFGCRAPTNRRRSGCSPTPSPVVPHRGRDGMVVRRVVRAAALHLYTSVICVLWCCRLITFCPPRDSLAVLIVSPSLFLRRKKNELISNKLFFSWSLEQLVIVSLFVSFTDTVWKGEWILAIERSASLEVGILFKFIVQVCHVWCLKTLKGEIKHPVDGWDIPGTYGKKENSMHLKRKIPPSKHWKGINCLHNNKV